MRLLIIPVLVIGLAACGVKTQDPKCASSFFCENKGTKCNKALGFEHQNLVQVTKDHCFKEDGSDGERPFCCDKGVPEAGIIKMYGVNYGDYPYMAYISGAAGACGAAIYNENYLITAAHCVSGGPSFQNFPEGKADKLTVKVYTVIERDTFGPIDKEKIYYSSGENIKPHPNYTHGVMPILNDVAVIRLDKPISKKMMGKYVKSLRLAKPNEKPGKAPKNSRGDSMLRAIAVGYGAADVNENLGVLLGGKLPLTFQDDSGCQFTAVDNDQILCIGGNGYGALSSGDSGSPGLCLDSRNRPYHCGIDSYVQEGCTTQLDGQCDELPPSAFVDIAIPEINQWIRNQLNGEKQKQHQLFQKLKSPLYEGKMLGAYEDYDKETREKILKNRRKNKS